MTTPVQLVLSLVIAAVGVVAASALALLLIPKLSLEATIRGGTIALLSVLCARVGMWWHLRRKQRGG